MTTSVSTHRPGVSEKLLATWFELALLVYAGAQLVLMLALFVNHWHVPFTLDLMEGTILQHFQRAATFSYVYPTPTPDYVPLAYNPLYYFFAVPFSWVTGVNLATLRLVAFLGHAVACLTIFLIIRRETASARWGLIGAGLFAAAYWAMDSYLDTAHSDSWLVASALIGSYLIAREPSHRAGMLGIVVLVAAFWFKQHGALFAGAAVLYLTWRDGVRASIPYWLVAAVLGPGLYFLAGPALFGPSFHFFTWEIPTGWSTIEFRTFLRYGGFVVLIYPLLTLAAGVGWVNAVRSWRRGLSIWDFQLVAAALSGFLGALDSDSSNNVFIPAGAFIILTGSIALARFAEYPGLRYGRAIALACAALSFLFVAYDPRAVWVPAQQAKATYRDLVLMIRKLDGPVYAPGIGQMPADVVLRPAAHWVALEDILRSQGHSPAAQAEVERLVRPALPNLGSAYLLTNRPLEKFGLLFGLAESYTLATDLGDRFSLLTDLRGKFDHGFPRYLYRYDASLKAATDVKPPAKGLGGLDHD